MSGQFDSHLRIKGELAASPAATLAVSIDQLQHAANAHELGLDLVSEFAQAIDAEALNGQLTDDIRVLQGALDILEGRTPIIGMGYSGRLVKK